MAIYRGSGGAGEANDDVTLNEIAASASAAADSATAAALSASNASDSETAATDASNAAIDAKNDAVIAKDAAEEAQGAAEEAQGLAEAAQGNAEDAQSYAEEWANKAEDSLISVAAGGDGTTEYSSLHHAAKAATSASNASTSESNAATSESNASDSADDASKLAVNAEDSQYTLSDGTTTGYSALHYNAKAGASASAASTSESNAADSASDASKLAVTAEDSQYTLADGTTTGYSALHYAAKAAASATAAEAAQEAIDGTYLGALASDPTVDGNGDAVTVGDWYFNTTVSKPKIYDGSAWDTIDPTLVSDTTPQLGGTLDANGNDIDMGTNTITDAKVGQWDTAYGWGDHSTQNYATETYATGEALALAIALG